MSLRSIHPMINYILFKPVINTFIDKVAKWICVFGAEWIITPVRLTSLIENIFNLFEIGQCQFKIILVNSFDYVITIDGIKQSFNIIIIRSGLLYQLNRQTSNAHNH